MVQARDHHFFSLFGFTRVGSFRHCLVLTSASFLCAASALAQAKAPNQAGPTTQTPLLLEVDPSTILDLPGVSSQAKDEVVITPGSAIHFLPEMKPLSTRCYTMQEYKFRKDPKSDAVRPAGSTSCVDAAQFQLKDATAKP